MYVLVYVFLCQFSYIYVYMCFLLLWTLQIAMRSIPEPVLRDETTNDEFERYFTELENSISKEQPVRSRNLRLTFAGEKVEETIQGKDGKSKSVKVVQDKEYLKFVPLSYREFKFNAVFDAENNYLKGVLTEEVNGCRICYLLVKNVPINKDMIDKIKRCVNKCYNSENKFVYTDIGVDYTDLEEVAGYKRTQIQLGKRALIEAVTFLSIIYNR